ncbi:MAG: hypothetical protein CMQ41_03515 [Gammaproteobacteria bacterium]|nr:hypothetical protein [Gammaproteobacteria bacterium]
MKFQWETFKQSNVARIFIAYAVVAFGLMQVFDYLLPIIEAPLWVAQTLTLLLFLGFPISLLVGWVTQRPIITSESGTRSSDSGYAHSLSRQKFVLIGLGSSALFGFLGLILMPYLLDQASFNNQISFEETSGQQPLNRSFRSSMMLGETGLRPVHNTRSDVAITGDGTKLAYTYMSESTAGQTIVIKDLTQPDSVREIGAMDVTNGSGLLFFSQDDEWLHFIDGGNISRVRIEGGSFQSINTQTLVLRSAFSAFDEKIIFSASEDQQLYEMPVSGGEASKIQSMNNTEAELKSYTWPRILPGNQKLLVTSSDNELVVGYGDIEVHDLLTGEIKTLIRSASNASYLRSGHIIFIRDSDLWAVPFDIENLELVGSQVPIIEGIETNSVYGHAAYTVSETGKLLYLPGGDRGATLNEGQTAWVTRSGDTVEIEADSGSFAHVRLSPNEDQMAFTRFGDGTSSDIFVWDIDRNTLGRRTFDGFASRPVWTPDGSQIIYSHSEEGLKAVASNGTELPVTLFETTDRVRPYSVSPNGEILFDWGSPPRIYVADLPLDAPISIESEADELLLSPTIFINHQSQISPDGNWISYVSNETGSLQVYVRPFPNINAGKWQASTEGGFTPLWNKNGRELFFFSQGNLSQMRVTYNVGAVGPNEKPNLIDFDSPENLFTRVTSVSPTTQPVWDYSLERESFLIIEPPNVGDAVGRILSAQTNLVVVENIFSELSSLVRVD